MDVVPEMAGTTSLRAIWKVPVTEPVYPLPLRAVTVTVAVPASTLLEADTL